MDLSENIYNNQSFQNLTAVPTDLSNKEFNKCTFKKCDFTACKFSGSILADCVFIACNLSNIKVDDCSFQNVSFEACKLLGIDFSNIHTLLISWTFKNSRVELCDFNRLDMRGSKFLECSVRETDFIGANLSGAEFMDSDLQASKFENTNLEKASFLRAKNYYLDPNQNRIRKAKFSQPEVLALLAGYEIEIE